MTIRDEIIEELKNQIVGSNSKIFYGDEEKKQILEHYAIVINDIFLQNWEAVLETFGKITQLKHLRNIPHSVILSEITFIKNRIANEILLENDAQKLFDLFGLFKTVENHIAEVFLNSYTIDIKNKNALRLKAIQIFKEKKIIKHYEQHLIWLNNLVDAIASMNVDIFPELNACSCEFGRWLSGDGKLSISNNSQYEQLEDAHNKLHLFASKLKMLISEKNKKEYISILTMLQKCECISVDIGIELSYLKSSEYMEKAHYDTLTNVLNRNYLDDIYENEFKLSKLTYKTFCIAMCDLDHFKQINDTYGHKAGDIVLKTFASFLKSKLRETDYIIRYGGEEFIILFPSTTLKNGVSFLERFREELSTLNIETNNQNVNISASFGIIEVNPNDSDRYEFTIENSIRRADEKLYYAKSNGRNRVEF